MGMDPSGQGRPQQVRGTMQDRRGAPLDSSVITSSFPSQPRCDFFDEDISAK